MNATLSDKIEKRPDLIREFRSIENGLFNVLKQGGETGNIRRSFDSLTERTMRELGTSQRPRGADFARADLALSARALSEGLAAAQVSIHPDTTTELAESIEPATRRRVSV